MEFKKFINDRDKQDIVKTLSKIPKKHKNLTNGYKFEFQIGNCLKKDPGHVGEIDEKLKTIKISAPWNYSRDFTLLHEIGHLVWKYILDKEKKIEWSKLIKNHSHPTEKNDEEAFCMVYANHYATHGVPIHTHKKWDSFIKSIN